MHSRRFFRADRFRLLVGADAGTTPVIAGVDEVGRGPLAGPVVAAAVVLDERRTIRGLNDSKLLTAEERERLDVQIRRVAVSFAIAEASVAEIDALNILRAALLAMRRAVLALGSAPHVVLVDGNQRPELPMAVRTVIGGDARVRAIAAASIIAKVHRDRLLRELHAAHPRYGFDGHKGYSTPEHLAALREHGPCIHHRRSFAPVRDAETGSLFADI
jgi:ribonuclease HII